MGRPLEPKILRLAHQVWARGLRHEVERQHPSGPADMSWSALEHLLVQQRHKLPVESRPNAKGLQGVAHSGTSPRRLGWKIPADEEHLELDDDWTLAVRNPSGPKSKDQTEAPKNYYCLEFDAVELGERLVPGSSRWMDCSLWWLASTRFPPLEDVRYCIEASLEAMGLVRPTVDERRSFIGEEAFHTLVAAPDEEIRESYRQVMAEFTDTLSPDSLSLLAALILESCLTNAPELEVHRDLASAAFERWSYLPQFEPLRSSLFSHVFLPLLDRPELLPIVSPTDVRAVPIRREDWIEMMQTQHSPPITPTRLPVCPEIDPTSDLPSPRRLR
ncbi:MAG: hypothetical protein IPK54_01145 [Dokdonella sp.]|uniref:hypothetical protein n=1 Tax=Dokdonella sp. TaxID=2291710 RepID=UPI0025BBB2D0|nr:hypothetical protein [Dokdonella sp.]MBK8122191.1 hypothetical protein [Dokdonella sp.]